MPPPFIIDQAQQLLFDRQGFVVMPFLSKKQIAALSDAFYTLQTTNIGDGFVSSTYSNDMAYKRRADRMITDITLPSVAQYFKDYSVLGGAFLHKMPGANSSLQMHQDWSIVDEKKCVSVNLWTPLINTDEYNGTLWVLPGSQCTEAFFTIRAPTIRNFYDEHQELLLQNMVPLRVSAGHVVVINHSLLHYSAANYSEKIRIAVITGLLTQNAQRIMHYQNPETTDDTIELYAVKDDFLMSYDDFFKEIFERPKNASLLETKKYTPASFSHKQMVQLINQMKTSCGYPATAVEQNLPAAIPPANTSWLKKLKNIFGKAK